MAHSHLLALSRCLAFLVSAMVAWPQSPQSWKEIRERFLATNPALQAGRLQIDEYAANEITAGLRPNPQLSFSADQFQFAPGGIPFRPFQSRQLTPGLSQLWERRNKRKLRAESAHLATGVAAADQSDFQRGLLFTIRDAFNRALLAKSLLGLARENLTYYAAVIDLNRQRYRAGDISRADLDRVELQRVQFEADLASSQTNLLNAKARLLGLLNDRETPVESFDIEGDLVFRESDWNRNELRSRALAHRPDLVSANRAIAKARVDHTLAEANGSTDPTLGVEYLYNPQVAHTIGFNVNVPLRLFDRNQGEKARTAIEVRRTERIRDDLTVGLLREVDSAHSSVSQLRELLRLYRHQYLQQAEKIREAVSFSYRNGAASLLDFLDAQKSYRDVHVAYRNLLGSYLTAVAQLGMSVGEDLEP